MGTSKMGLLLVYSVIFLVAVGNIHAGANDEDSIAFDGDATNLLLLHLCDSEPSISLAGAVTNIKLFKKKEEAEGLKALEEAKSRGLPVISIPCEGKMKIEGDTTDMVLVVHSEQEANDEDSIVLDGNATNFQIIYLCDQNLPDVTATGITTNMKLFEKKEEAEGLKALEEAKSRRLPVISIPCEGKMKIEGDTTDMVLVFGKPKAN